METASDTSREAEEVRHRLLREMSPWRKVQLLTSCIRSSRRLLRAGLRARYPQASEEELEDRFRRLVLGDELAEAAYGAPGSR